jgi:hypothetical protein
MNCLFNNIIKRKTKKLVEKIGCGLDEVLVEIYISFTVVDSIEISNNEILLHNFEKDDYDIVYDYDLISEEDKLIIYENLKKYLEYL